MNIPLDWFFESKVNIKIRRPSITALQNMWVFENSCSIIDNVLKKTIKKTPKNSISKYAYGKQKVTLAKKIFIS